VKSKQDKVIVPFHIQKGGDDRSEDKQKKEQKPYKEDLR
jgi:hypothetical protein